VTIGIANISHFAVMKDADRPQKNWRTVRLADVAEARLGKMLDAQKNRGRLHPYLRNPNVRWFDIDLADLREMPFEEDEEEKFSIREGDVLICEGGEAGRAAIWKGADAGVKFQKAIHRVRAGPELSNRFLVHRLFYDYHSGRLADYYTGATISHFTGKDLARYEFALPPLDEQRRIAAILDQADDLRRKRREAFERLELLHSSIFVNMFGNIETNDHGWDEEALSGVVRGNTIVTYGIVQAGDEVEDGVPYIRTGDIVDGEIRLSQLRHTDPAIAAKFGRSRVEADEIVMSIRATVGTTAFVPSELDGANLTQGTARISPGKRTDRHYLLAFLRSNFAQNWIQRQVKGATFREITLTRLREMPILVPPLELQRAFAARATEIDALKVHHRAHLAKFDVLFASLQHRAFRGEL
jgi:type I restriction enzyme S subunit